MSEVDLEALYDEGIRDGGKGPVYKTVATFAGLTNRKLWLKHSANAQTDGHEILAPLDDPYMYQLVEHELAHILFQSNVAAKVAFIKGYGEQMNVMLKKNGLEFLDEDQTSSLYELLNTVIGVLEDTRVESLWGLLYPGSYAIQQEMHRVHIRPQLKNTHRTLASFLVVASTGVETPSGEFDRYKPALEEAMRKVERRGFTATLIVSKWLVQKLVDEAVRRMRGIRSDPSAQNAAQNLAQRVLGKKAAAAAPEKTNTDDKASAPAEATPTEFKPEPVETSPAQRREGLTDLIKREGTPSALVTLADDWKAPRFPSHEETDDGKRMARAALDAKVGEEELTAFLTFSERKMAERVEELREVLAEPVEVEGWMTKNTFGKVNLKDVEAGRSNQLEASDMQTANRLRALFYRMMGRRKSMLHETGSAIDVMSYIEAQVSKQPVPCFTHEDRGRGFKVMVLIDRSSSMAGEKTREAERACKVLMKALDFPFVDFHVWGFQSHKDGELDITRFNKRALAFQTKAAKVGGNTPLHLALRVAIRFMELGDEQKQVIVITDGWPSFSSKKGDFSTRTLSRFTREEVLRARRIGMNVTGVVIGNDMKDANLSFMLGPQKNWKRMTAGRLGEGLVQVATSSFTQYLRNG